MAKIRKVKKSKSRAKKGQHMAPEKNLVPEQPPLAKVLGVDLREHHPRYLTKETIRRLRKLRITTVGELYIALYLRAGMQPLTGIGRKSWIQAQNLLQTLYLHSRIGLQDIWKVVAGEAAIWKELDLKKQHRVEIATLHAEHDSRLNKLNDEINMLLGDVVTRQARERSLMDILQDECIRTLGITAPHVTAFALGEWLAKHGGEPDADTFDFEAIVSDMPFNNCPELEQRLSVTVPTEVMRRLWDSSKRKPGEIIAEQCRVGFSTRGNSRTFVEANVRLYFESGNLFTGRGMNGEIEYSTREMKSLHELFRSLGEFRHPLADS